MTDDERAYRENEMRQLIAIESDYSATFPDFDQLARLFVDAFDRLKTLEERKLNE